MLSDSYFLFDSCYKIEHASYVGGKYLTSEYIKTTLENIMNHSGTSLVAQWLRIHLPMQGTWVRALVWEDPTCHGAIKPVRHNYWACCALEPVSHNYWAHVPQLWSPRASSPCSATREATAMRSSCTTTKSSPCSLQPEKSPRAATKTQHSQK